MRSFCYALIVALLPLAPAVSAEAEWYVGYTFVYSGSGNSCAFMRFRSDSYSLGEADAVYRLFADRLADQVGTDATFADVPPSEALAEGKTGEGMAAEFLSQGVGACEVAGDPVSGLIFISSFGCDYQNEAQMCIRSYLDAGDRDLTAQGIGSGPAGLGGDFVNRQVWDASSDLVYAGQAQVPHVVDAALTHAASTISLVTD